MTPEEPGDPDGRPELDIALARLDRATETPRELEPLVTRTRATTRRRPVTERAVSETLVVIWRRVDALPADPLEARMWMFGIARRVLSTYRRGGFRRQLLAERLRAELATLPASPTPDEHPHLADALEALGPADRDLIRLVHHDGFNLAEVARLLGKRPATIRSRYQRARMRLRAALEN